MERELSPAYRVFSRAVDFGFVLTVSILLSWLLLLCWVAVRLTSGGPAIFKQARVGRDGDVFICYKFRTMRQGTRQAATHELTANVITPVGHFLRRSKLDELPQVVNLFRGEMSLVGPRPCLPSQQELIDWRARLGVLAVRPGITGLAQINGVDMSDPEALARMDCRYIAARSITLDLKIILATVRGGGSGDFVRQA